MSSGDIWVTRWKKSPYEIVTTPHIVMHEEPNKSMRFSIVTASEYFEDEPYPHIKISGIRHTTREFKVKRIHKRKRIIDIIPLT